ncbi:MAG TPA: aldehyde dehydrogenase family protein [Solirubrobacterales bacterium]|nr:aldehyde dehydrogenase family protein [Solirubrobacterales bacterium]
MESATSTTEATETATNGAAADAGSPRETFDVHRPVDGSVITSVAIASPAEVAERVARARAAQREWEAIGFGGRRHWLERLRDWIFDNQDRLDTIMQEETGKVRADAALEAFYCVDAINFWNEQGPKWLADEIVTPHVPLLRTKRHKIAYRPYGVVGLISPWNFPVILSLGDSIPALIAGNAAVIKPSEITPLTVTEMARAWREDIGAPDVLHVVNGMAETAGALIDEVDYLQFTGSERTGKIVMKRAAETLTPVSLELGGKDPMIVTRDADVDRAVNATAWGGLVNTGQICISIERVYVEEPIYDEFVTKLQSTVETLRQGADGDTYTAEVGAMTSPAQAGIVSEQVEDAREKGARVLTGGRRKDGPGDWYEPTVIADVDHSMKVMTDETFGPVIPVMKVKDVDEAVELANDTKYGLGSSVFAGDPEEGERIARRIEAGHCNVNDVLVNYNVLGLPMGGWKNSGIGVRHGAAGIRRFCHTEALTVPRMRQLKSEPFWFPYNARKRGFLRRTYRFLNARGRKRIG